VLITHEADIAEYTGRRVTLRDGRIVSDETVARVRDAAAELASRPPAEPEEEDDGAS
jgi:ABC-type phosphate/phosphonate transport system ATPase subunit